MTPAGGSQPLAASETIAIRQLYGRYAFAIDLRDVEGWLACFCPDGTLGRAPAPGAEAPPPRRGHAELRAMAESATTPPGSTYHWTANLELTAVPGGAQGRCAFMLVRAAPGKGEPVIVGYMRDELVQAKGVWLFHSRIMHVG